MNEPDPERCVCTALRQAARRVSQHYDSALSSTGISTNQYAILRRLERFGPSTVQALAARLVMDRSTLGHLLRPLQAQGLVGLGTSADDRRRRQITLTEAGTQVLVAARPLWEAAQATFEQAYGADAAQRLRVDLRRVSTFGAAPRAGDPARA